MDANAVVETLSAERAATLARIAAMTADLDAVAAAAAGSNIDDEHDPEGSTVAFEREQLAALRATAERHVAEIDAALRRLADGTYGVCGNCGEPIASERLDALPATQFCVSCAARGRR
jgi:DnaK suppressor protein